MKTWTYYFTWDLFYIFTRSPFFLPSPLVSLSPLIFGKWLSFSSIKPKLIFDICIEENAIPNEIYTSFAMAFNGTKFDL